MFSFFIRNRNSECLAGCILKCHYTIQHIRTVMNIYIGSNDTKVCNLAGWRTIFGNRHLNETLFAVVCCGKKIIRVTIYGAYCFIQSTGTIKSPIIISIFQLFPRGTIPFKPCMSLGVIVTLCWTDKTRLQRKRISRRLRANFYNLYIRFIYFCYIRRVV